MTGKPIRLGKAAGELNVGISTLVEFLASKGIEVAFNPNTKLSAEEFEILRNEFHPAPEDISISFLENELSEYFDLNIKNTDLYAAGDVEKGVHGIEFIEGDFYASLFHIQQSIAKGELKKFLQQFVGSKMLKELGNSLQKEYNFNTVKVKYNNQAYQITKYPLVVILDFYKRNLSGESSALFEAIENTRSIGLNELGVKNYRRFESLTSLNLSQINFFVGQNNAGKSTMVEALRLLISYLNQSSHEFIDLNPFDGTLNLNRSFGRLINFKKKGDIFEDLTIEGKFDDCHFSLKIFGAENQTKPELTELRIDNGYITLVIDFKSADLEVQLQLKNDEMKLDEMESLAQITQIETEIFLVEQELNALNISFNDKLRLANERNKLLDDLKRAKSLVRKTKGASNQKEDVMLKFELLRSNFSQFSIQSILDEIFILNDEILKSPGKEAGEVTAYRKEFDQRYPTIDIYFKSLFSRIRKTDLHYLEGTSVKFSTILKPNDNQDNLLKSIRYLNEQGVFSVKNHMTMRFIEKWIGKDGFDFGKRIRVRDMEGEVFSIEIETEKWQLLSDFGLGAQRLFELIIGIAKIIHHYQTVDQAFEPIILIEEPEAHIHPALQSRLADFFYQINFEYDLRFIVETHSEYIIRKSQLIGLNEGLFIEDSLNPFNVIYFDKKEGPYNMVYGQDGQFEREFGNGFYDVVDDIAMDIFLNKNRKKV